MLVLWGSGGGCDLWPATTWDLFTSSDFRWSPCILWSAAGNVPMIVSVSGFLIVVKIYSKILRNQCTGCFFFFGFSQGAVKQLFWGVLSSIFYFLHSKIWAHFHFGTFELPLKIFLFLKMKFINFFLIPMDQKYQNESVPIFCYAKSAKDCLKLLNIADLQPPDWIQRKKTRCMWYIHCILFLKKAIVRVEDSAICRECLS